MKKIIALMMVIVISLSFSLSAFAAGRYGDVTNDNKVNSSDALKILLVTTGRGSLTSAQRVYADLNGDKKINSADALLVLQYSVSLISVFPVEKGEDPDIDHDYYG